MSIGNNIKKLRELKNYTQSYMAQKLDMSVPGYSKIENDKTDITVSKIYAIAQVLETDLATILNFDARNVFHQYNNQNSVITGYNHQLNLNGNIDKILANIQQEINELKKRSD